ncbi:MAG: endolytic transglycosylase MltG [Bacteroidales bacterium]|nr:endolytic transglycosylase MltG [Bacteroidales bacterium]
MVKRKNKALFKKILAFAGALFLIGALVAGYLAYVTILKPNVDIGPEYTHFFIPTGSTFEDVKEALLAEGIVENEKTFQWLAEKKRYTNRVLPGRYRIYDDMGNNELINLLRSGVQDPVNVTFNNIRTKEQLAGVVAGYIEADSLSIINLLGDAETMQEYGLTTETAVLLFIPNTYEFFWNTSAQQLLNRMNREHNAFWTRRRLQQAEKIGMTPIEVAIMASIVRQETSKRDEMATIAGVYVNRIKRNIPLQADPTVVFAVGDFTINRVLNRHLAIDSPYNTYKYPGLPPGPISLPEPYIIDAVLNYEDHEYVFFCARDDFSGYHAFAKTYSEHLQNARRYQRALNERRIMQ